MLRIFLRRDTCGFAAVAAALACRSHALCSANQNVGGKRDSGATLVTQQAPEPWQPSHQGVQQFAGAQQRTHKYKNQCLLGAKQGDSHSK